MGQFSSTLAVEPYHTAQIDSAMPTLNDCLSIDKRGKAFYEVPRAATLAEKSHFIDQFLALHVGRKHWSVRMHTARRSFIPIYGTICFRTTKTALGKLVVLFDQTTFSKNMEEVTLVWKKMIPMAQTSSMATK